MHTMRDGCRTASTAPTPPCSAPPHTAMASASKPPGTLGAAGADESLSLLPPEVEQQWRAEQEEEAALEAPWGGSMAMYDVIQRGTSQLCLELQPEKARPCAHACMLGSHELCLHVWVGGWFFLGGGGVRVARRAFAGLV